MALKNIWLLALITFASLGVGVIMSLLPDGKLDANATAGIIFVAVPTSLPLLLLWRANVRLIWGWMLIVAALMATWGWVVYEITKPYEGGGVNFAPLSGMMICLLLCVASAMIVNCDQGRRAR